MKNRPKLLSPLEINVRNTGYPGPYIINSTQLERIFPNYKDCALVDEMSALRGKLRKDHFGMMDPREANLLLSIAQTVQPETIFEIGTGEGIITKYLSRFTSAKIYTLDIGDDKSRTSRFKMDGWNSRVLSRRDKVGTAIRNGRLKKRITQFIEDSGKFDFTPFYGKMDMVIVDGNHSYESANNDLSEAFKMLSSEGIVFVDDYLKMCHFSGVTLAVLENAIKRNKIFYHPFEKDKYYMRATFHIKD